MKTPPVHPQRIDNHGLAKLTAEGVEIPPGHGINIVGIRMREHYAGLAMQGMVSSIHDERGYDRLKLHAQVEGLTVSQWIARDSFKQADAMLSAGEKAGELERITAERDALARAVLAWWDEWKDDGAIDGVCRNGEEPEFVTQAIALGIEP